MFNKRGMTLVETLLAFSIFVSCVVLIFSCYNMTLRHYQNNNREYQEYLASQAQKELKLWQSNDLLTSIQEVLP